MIKLLNTYVLCPWLFWKLIESTYAIPVMSNRLSLISYKYDFNQEKYKQYYNLHIKGKSDHVIFEEANKHLKKALSSRI